MTEYDPKDLMWQALPWPMLTSDLDYRVTDAARIAELDRACARDGLLWSGSGLDAAELQRTIGFAALEYRTRGELESLARAAHAWHRNREHRECVIAQGVRLTVPYSVWRDSREAAGNSVYSQWVSVTEFEQYVGWWAGRASAWVDTLCAAQDRGVFVTTAPGELMKLQRVLEENRRRRLYADWAYEWASMNGAEDACSWQELLMHLVPSASAMSVRFDQWMSDARLRVEKKAVRSIKHRYSGQALHWMLGSMRFVMDEVEKQARGREM